MKTYQITMYKGTRALVSIPVDATNLAEAVLFGSRMFADQYDICDHFIARVKDDMQEFGGNHHVQD